MQATNAPSQLVWKPAQNALATSRLGLFVRHVQEKYGERFGNYHELHQWSVVHTEEFWEAVWDFVGIESEEPYTSVVDDLRLFPGASWFPGARVNAAETLMRYCFMPAYADRIAVKGRGETDAASVDLTYGDLLRQVHGVQTFLLQAGVKRGDRVAAVVPNTPGTVVCMLAALSIGAVWSSCAPSFGVGAIVERFAQVSPTVLVCCDSYTHKGKQFDVLGKAKAACQTIESIHTVLVLGTSLPEAVGRVQRVQTFAKAAATDVGNSEIYFERVPVSHPILVMFSSGTTGPPKCLVQGYGVVLNHLKELLLHVDVGQDDVVFFYTTCAWMMWNWLVSALGCGATIMLFEGSPTHPHPGSLLNLAVREGTTVFGTSASFVRMCEQHGVGNSDEFKDHTFRSILSTGSPLHASQFLYLAKCFGNVQVSSISGGTELNGCLVLGCPLLPVHCGEIQCRALGIDVSVFNEAGEPVVGVKGELVVRKPFPSMPLEFWGDSNHAKYKDTYFSKFPNVWCHGDFAVIVPRTAGIVLLGRSDATLNVHGIRTGTAEIYKALERVEEVEDALAIEYKANERSGHTELVVFVKVIAECKRADLEAAVKAAMRDHLSPQHVPHRVIPVPDIPYTTNGKKVELAVVEHVHGNPVRNKNSLRNPECLSHFVVR